MIELQGSRHGGETIRRHFEEEFAGWQEGLPLLGQSLFGLTVAPERLQKAGFSGGEPYHITVPDGCADALINAETIMPFVAYLNWVFSNGGFPWQAASGDAWRIKQALATGLLPL